MTENRYILQIHRPDGPRFHAGPKFKSLKAAKKWLKKHGFENMGCLGWTIRKDKQWVRKYGDRTDRALYAAFGTLYSLLWKCDIRIRKLERN
jgi:hypothetical protein